MSYGLAAFLVISNIFMFLLRGYAVVKVINLLCSILSMFRYNFTAMDKIIQTTKL